jgi:hypothetical protein
LNERRHDEVVVEVEAGSHSKGRKEAVHKDEVTSDELLYQEGGWWWFN